MMKSKNYVLKGSKVDIDVASKTLELDKLVYDFEFQIDRKLFELWYKRNPDIYTLLFEGNKDEIIGYINAIPLNKFKYDAILKENDSEKTVEPKNICKIDYNGINYILFSSIVIHPKYQRTKALAILVRAFIEEIEVILVNGEVNIVVDLISKEGSQLYSHFKKIDMQNLNIFMIGEESEKKKI